MSVRQKHDFFAQALDLFAAKVKDRAHVLQRREAVDPLARLDDSQRKLAIDASYRGDGVDWRVVEIDDASVEGVGKVWSTDTCLKRQSRIRSREPQRLLTFRQSVVSMGEARV